MSQGESHRVLRRMQRQLHRLYALDEGADVHDFLIEEKSGPFSGEQTVVVMTPEEVCVGVYLDPDLLRLLERSDPWLALDSSNLFPFCRVLEEVSHFIYLEWNAGHDKPVTALEMELQAEVDKFMLSVCYLSVQNRGRVPQDLAQTVLYAGHIDSRLDAALVDRYRSAQQLASRYCTHLQKHYLQSNRFGELVPELRRFYRKSQYGKIDHIHSLN